MIIPIRCFSCGKVGLPVIRHARDSQELTTRAQVTGDLWERYLKLIDEGVTDGFAISDTSGLKHGTYPILQ